MCPSADEHNFTRIAAVIDLVDQQKITANMAFPVFSPIALERMVPPFRAERRMVRNQQHHHGFEADQIIAAGMG